MSTVLPRCFTGRRSQKTGSSVLRSGHAKGATALHRDPLRNWSGRPDSNRRRPAWEAPRALSRHIPPPPFRGVPGGPLSREFPGYPYTTPESTPEFPNFWRCAKAAKLTQSMSAQPSVLLRLRTGIGRTARVAVVAVPLPERRVPWVNVVRCVGTLRGAITPEGWHRHGRVLPVPV
jgi:hypothetical protein